MCALERANMYKVDYCTTSFRFTPGKENGPLYYHHPELGGKWKKGTVLKVRATQSGIDYIIRFKEDGRPVDETVKDPDKRWKYYAEYEIIEKSTQDDKNKRRIPPELQKSVIKRQDNRCNLCGMDFNDDNKSQFDHILEMSCGGLTEENNLQALCRYPCHNIKTEILKDAKKKGIIDQYQWDKNVEASKYFDDYLRNYLRKIVSKS